jgi:protein-tyrosine phosphatase
MRDEWVGTSETDPIQVDFLRDDEAGTPGRLGMTFAPGMWAGSVGGRWERDLATDMRALEEEHETDVLVSLMEGHEYRGYRIPELLERDSFGGIEVLRFAIEDMGVPREAESEGFEAFVGDVVQRMKQGQNVVIHCRGGVGRTGTLAACVLVALGRHSADEAIAAVREARKGTVQTREQEDFVRLFEGMVKTQGNEGDAMAAEDKSDGPTVVPAEVIEGLEAVRRSGANMVERAHVLVLAKRMGYRQTVRWVEDRPEEYARGVSLGFEAVPEEGE